LSERGSTSTGFGRPEFVATVPSRKIERILCNRIMFSVSIS